MTNWRLRAARAKNKTWLQEAESLSWVCRSGSRGLAIAALTASLMLLGLPPGCRRNAVPTSENTESVSRADVFLVFVDGKDGLINARGEPIVEPRFEAIFENQFRQGLIPAKLEGRWGFIDIRGQYVIPPRYGYVRRFSEGVAAVSIDGKVGFIDTSGDFIIGPRFHGAGDFWDGRAAVQMENPDPPDEYGYKPERWGYIDKTGRYVVEPTLSYAEEFSDGLAVISLPDNAVVRYYIDTNGEVVAGPFWRAYSMYRGIARVAVGRTNDILGWGILDCQGNYVIEPIFDDLKWPSEGLTRARDWRDGEFLFGFVDCTSTFVIPMRYEWAWDFSEGLAAVWDGTKWGFIDKTGEYVIAPQFDGVWRNGFRHGLAAVNIGGEQDPQGPVAGGKWGYINKVGEWIISPRYDMAYEFTGSGVAQVWIDEKRGYINRQGEYIWEPSK